MPRAFKSRSTSSERKDSKRTSPSRSGAFESQSALPDPLPWPATARLYEDDTGEFALHEPLDEYKPGGFHPVALWDRFNSRYVIRHKLGFGGQSTVWVAWDEKERSFVSLKIKKGKFSTIPRDQDPEITIPAKLEQAYRSKNNPPPRWFVPVLDDFSHTGPNGTHTCIVTELTGPSLNRYLRNQERSWDYEANRPSETLRPDTILRTAQQLVDAVRFAHEEAGFVHGDISTTNLVFSWNRIRSRVTQDDGSLDEDEFFRNLGGSVEDSDGEEGESSSPCCRPATALWRSDCGYSRPARLPRELVRVASWIGWYDNPEEDLRVIDWGTAFPVDRHPKPMPYDLIQPLNLRSPETFFVGSFDRRHDLWRVGCVIYRLVFQYYYPFRSFRHDGVDMVREMIAKLGPLPRSWQDKWLEMVKEAGEDVDAELPVPYSASIAAEFPTRVDEIRQICEADSDGFYCPDTYSDYDFERLGECLLPVVKGLLRYQPEERISLAKACKLLDWTDHRKDEGFDPWANNRAEDEDGAGVVDYEGVNVLEEEGGLGLVLEWMDAGSSPT